MSSDEADKVRERLPFSEIHEIYKKLLIVYAEKGFKSPEGVLESTIKYLINKGRTREEAILQLYQKETIETDGIYEKLLVEYAARGVTNPEATLEQDVKSFVDGGKTREQAITLIWEEKSTEMSRRHDVDQIVEQHEEKIKRLAVLFSRGEINEESYKTSVKAIEENIGRVRRGVEFPKVREEPRLSSVSSEYAQARGWVEAPTRLWWLVPFFFGLIGGIVGYVGVKEDDEEMASGLLVFGVIWSIILFIVGYGFLFGMLSH